MRTDALSFVPVERGIEHVNYIIATTQGMKPTDEQAMNLLTASCPIFDTDLGECYRFSDLQAFTANLVNAIENKDSSYLRMQRGLKVDQIVSVEEFCESKEYMGQKDNLRPVVKRGLVELFSHDRYIECVLTGSIGWGKTYFSYLAMAYMIYKLSCFYNPQLEYGLAPGSSIVFIQQSQKYELAKKVVFDQFSNILRRSPYFTERFAFDPEVKSELRFPSNILVLPVGGSDTAAIGMNVFGGVVDEMNFMAKVKHSEHTGGEGYDQAEQIYRSLIRRMKSRFMQFGELPGKLLLISSVNYEGDFTSRKLEEAKTDPTILSLSYAQWDALPADRFTGEKFLVEVGSAERQSRIIRDLDHALHVESVIHVPVEYKRDFERDIEAALKDYAGITTGVRRPFIPFRAELLRCQEEYVKMTGRPNLFKVNECIISELMEEYGGDFSYLIDEDFFDDMYLTESIAFAAHCDVGLTGDAAGFAVGHIAGYKLLASGTYFNKRTQLFEVVRDMRAPLYMIDGVLRLVAPPSGEVELDYVRELILYLRSKLNLKYFSADWYQSAQLLQTCRRVKIRAGVLSVDASIEPYTEVKLSIKDERIMLPNYDFLGKELRELERDDEKDKIDHPAGGSKDCADAVAGVVNVLQRKEAKYGFGQRTGRSSRTQVETTEEPVRKIRVGRMTARGRNV